MLLIFDFSGDYGLWYFSVHVLLSESSELYNMQELMKKCPDIRINVNVLSVDAGSYICNEWMLLLVPD